jgi:hypothetical protein
VNAQMACARCGSPLPARHRRYCSLECYQLPWPDRFWAKVEKTEGCWLWRGGNNGRYGKMARPGRRTVILLAHRVAYELAVGEIPAGYQIDHLCRTPLCVNPAHLEAVLPRENVGRALAKHPLIKTCTVCGSSFETPVRRRARRTCGKECAQQSNRRRRNVATNPIVRPGQVWESCDRRELRPVQGRKNGHKRLRVDRLVTEDTGTYADCTVINAELRERAITRVRIDRFRPTSNGYRLIDAGHQQFKTVLLADWYAGICSRVAAALGPDLLRRWEDGDENLDLAAEVRALREGLAA